MTSLDKIYDKFLEKVKDDDWDDPSLLVSYEKTWRGYLEKAIALFRFPKHSLEIDEEADAFKEDLTIQEIQILAEFMRAEWLSANVTTWEKIKTDYGEKDFSQANLLDKLDKTLNTANNQAKKLESIYYRTDAPGQPFDYKKMAGKGNE